MSRTFLCRLGNRKQNEVKRCFGKIELKETVEAVTVQPSRPEVEFLDVNLTLFTVTLKCDRIRNETRS